MAGRVSFSIEFFVDDPTVFPEMAGRLRDFRAPFENVVDEWSKGNQAKFDEAIGKESSGAEVDPGVFWEPLSPQYMLEKRERGMADNIMVATGELRQQMTDPEGTWRVITGQEAVFGMPKGFEEEMKLEHNFRRRQVMFLSIDDQRMIDREVKAYLELGDNYRDLLFAKGMKNLKEKTESARMDMEFESRAIPPYDPTGDAE